MGVWVFLLLSLGSFQATDWPSHAVYPYPAMQNLCGPVGAYIAYQLYFTLGQGVFPLLFFGGVCVVVFLFQAKISDVWMRLIGLFLLSVAFATLVHHFFSGTGTGFPEGNGGIIGIGAEAFLRQHVNVAGTRLILAVTLLVGLLLAADDLVLRAPVLVGNALSQAGKSAPRLSMPHLPTWPKLPAWHLFHRGPRPTKLTTAAPRVSRFVETDDSDEPLRPQVLLKIDRKKAAEPTPEPIELTYADDAAHHAADDPGPSEAAVIPAIEPTLQARAVVNGLPAASGASDTGAVGGAASASAKAPGEPPTSVARNDIIVKLPNTLKPRQVSPPTPPPKELGEYHLPDWSCLAEAEHGYAESQEKFVREKAAVLEQALMEFSIDAHVVEIDTGPVITMYELSLAPGIKVSAITSLSNDIARALSATSVRIVAPVPGKNTVGIEVPNAQKEKVRLKELLQLAPEAMHKQAIPLFLGKDASGEPLITDLTAMPHCLIAGTTGSGKSVCINTIIMSIMYLQRPDVVKLILVDPKVVEMAPFRDVPHLMCPVINDSAKATSVLDWACEKMDERYEFLAEAGVRNIKDYNKMSWDELKERFQPGSEEEEAKIPKHLPYIVLIIDELADLMMTSGKEVEAFIVRLAQKSRAVGIHLILATQRPQANVVTGLIKSNMPSRIAFRVSSRMDSRIVLDQNGADLLLGQGDMLFLPPGASKPIRSQGTYIDDKEIRDSVKLVRGLADAQYEPELVQIKTTGALDSDAAKDDLFDDAVRVVLETKRGSVSLLQRRLTIGYSRASRLIEAMAQAGIVGDYKGSQAREAMLTVEEWEALKAQQQVDRDSGMTA